MGDSGLSGPCLLLALAEASLRKLRTAIVDVVWSRRQSLANTGAVLSLLDGPGPCVLRCLVSVPYASYVSCLSAW